MLGTVPAEIVSKGDKETNEHRKAERKSVRDGNGSGVLICFFSTVSLVYISQCILWLFYSILLVLFLIGSECNSFQ
jgi:hypothetical protein